MYIGPVHLMAAMFFIVGHCLAIMKVPQFNTWQLIISFGFVVVNSFYSMMPPGGPFYDNYKLIPYMVTAIFGTWCIYSFPWHIIKGSMAKFMQYVGEHTLTILIWHLLSFKVISLMIVIVYGLCVQHLAEFPSIEEYSDKGWGVIYTATGVALPLLMIYSYESVKAGIKAVVNNLFLRHTS